MTGTADKAQIHIITGGTGAGKTSYARALAAQHGAICFSIDDWMVRLFWMDSPQPISFDWTMERIQRVEAQMRDNVTAIARLGVGSVLDLGFTKRAHRAEFAQFAKGLGLGVMLHWLDVPADERWRRVVQRNAEKGASFAMEVDRAMFDCMEDAWQAPTMAEADYAQFNRVT